MTELLKFLLATPGNFFGTLVLGTALFYGLGHVAERLPGRRT